MKKLYLIPFFYFFHTRIANKTKGISWIIIYSLAPLIYLYENINPTNIISFFIMYITINYIYENGYIQNDTYTTKKENNPTERLSPKELKFYNTNFYKIVLIRFFILLFLCFILYFLIEKKSFINFLFGLFLIQIFYLIYNQNRKFSNILIIPLLTYLRFYLPITICILSQDYVNYQTLVLLFFIYPFQKFLEFFKLEKYKNITIERIIGNIDKFRIKYHFFMFIIIYYIDQTQSFFNFIFVLNIALLFYRISLFFYIKKHKLDKKTDRFRK